MGLRSILLLLCCVTGPQDVGNYKPVNTRPARPEPVWSEKKPRRRRSAERYTHKTNIDIVNGSYPMLSGLQPTTEPIVVKPKRTILVPSPAGSIMSRPLMHGPSQRTPVLTRGIDKRSPLTPHSYMDQTGSDQTSIHIDPIMGGQVSPMALSSPMMSPSVTPLLFHQNEYFDNNDNTSDMVALMSPNHSVRGGSSRGGSVRGSIRDIASASASGVEYLPTAANMHNSPAVKPKKYADYPRRTSATWSPIAKEAPRRVLHTEPHVEVIDEKKNWTWGKVNFGHGSASFNIRDMTKKFDDLAARGITSYRP